MLYNLRSVGLESFVEPWELVSNWMTEAVASEVNDPDAAALATVGEQKKPRVRMVLVRHVGKEGAYFYFNESSKKGQQIKENPYASLLWHWKSLRLQIRMDGSVDQMEDALIDKYFDQRPRASKISAWASRQSMEMKDIGEFTEHLKEIEKKFENQAVTRPEWWKGYILTPETIEFWQDGEARRHDRLLFQKHDHKWQKSWLYP